MYTLGYPLNYSEDGAPSKLGLCKITNAWGSNISISYSTKLI
jgi:hypothetical protein